MADADFLVRDPTGFEPLGQSGEQAAPPPPATDPNSGLQSRPTEAVNKGETPDFLFKSTEGFEPIHSEQAAAVAGPSPAKSMYRGAMGQLADLLSATQTAGPRMLQNEMGPLAPELPDTSPAKVGPAGPLKAVQGQAPPPQNTSEAVYQGVGGALTSLPFAALGGGMPAMARAALPTVAAGGAGGAAGFNFGPWAGLGAGILGGGAAAGLQGALEGGASGLAGLRKTTVALPEGQIQARGSQIDAAAKQLGQAAGGREGAEQAVSAAAQPRLPEGGEPAPLTMAQAAPDNAGLQKLQGQLAKRPGDFGKEAFQGRAEEQAAGQASGAMPLAPAGAEHGSLGSWVMDRMNALEGQADTLADRPVMAPGTVSSDQAGQQLRGQLEQGKQASKQQLSQAWSSVDPNGMWTLQTTPVVEKARLIAEGIDPRAGAELGAGEGRLLQAPLKWGAEEKFGLLRDYRSNLAGAIRQYRQTGDTQAAARMQQMKGAVDQAIAQAIDETPHENLQGLIQSLNPPQTAPVDAYRQAVQQTAEHHGTFSQGAVGKVLAPGPGGAPYRTSDSLVPSTLFARPEAADQFLRAVSSSPDAAAAAPQAVRDSMLSDLTRRRIIDEDGNVNAARFATWRAARADVLGKFPDVDQEFQNVQQVAEAQSARLASAQQEVRQFNDKAAKFFTSGVDPEQAVKEMLGGSGGPSRFAQLVQQVKGAGAAEDSLKLHMAQYFRDNVANQSPEKVEAWIAQNKPSLRGLFGGQGINQFNAIAADMRRTEAMQTATKGAGPRGQGELSRSVGQTIWAIAGEHVGGLAHWIPGARTIGLVAGAIAKPLFHAFRAAGIDTRQDLLAAALLHPTSDFTKTLLTRIPAQSGLTPVITKRLTRGLQQVVAADLARHSSNLDQGDGRQPQ